MIIPNICKNQKCLKPPTRKVSDSICRFLVQQKHRTSDSSESRDPGEVGRCNAGHSNDQCGCVRRRVQTPWLVMELSESSQKIMGNAERPWRAYGVFIQKLFWSPALFYFDWLCCFSCFFSGVLVYQGIQQWSRSLECHCRFEMQKTWRKCHERPLTLIIKCSANHQLDFAEQ